MQLERLREEDALGARDAAEEPLRLAYIGPLVRESGVGEALHGLHLARRRGASARLVIAGGGEHENCLRRMVERLALEPVVQFRGPVFAEARVQLLRGADFALLPQLDVGLLHALNFCLAAGVPAIARRTGSAGDAIIEQMRGLLLAGGSAAEYGSAFVRLAAERARP